MSQIKILSENLANQIAAGEVVERPSSVVKELVENAIDAGAQNISVQIEGGGTRLIRVIDDGSGMDQDDLLLCLERHATSKLTCVEQLLSIDTLGFRGEAIPSIASVSKMTVTSKVKDATLGNRIEIVYGTLKKVHEMGCSQGTSVEVENLFGNVPARRKFLKTNQTEISHIDEIVRSYCLVNNQLGVVFQVNGKSVFELPVNTDSIERRVRQILGVSGDLVPVGKDQAADNQEQVRVYGHLVLPEQAFGKAGRLWIFVNGRSIKDRMVSHAVGEGLAGFMMKGRRAAGVLFLTLPPDRLDVNVHPAKQEVRFHKSNQVHTAVVNAVQKGVADFQGQLKYAVFGEPEKVETDQQVKPLISPLSEKEMPWSESVSMEPQPFLLKREEPAEQSFPVGGDSRKSSGQPVMKSNRLQPSEPASPRELDDSFLKSNGAVSGQDLPKTSFAKEQSAMRYIGQALGTFILCETVDGLVVIDQHAAQERLFFEEFKKHYAGQDMPSQMLMFSAMVDLGAEDISTLEQNKDEVVRLGLVVEEFGGESYVIKSVPAALSHLSPQEILQGILNQFAAAEDQSHRARLEQVLAGMACKAAIKAGHSLKSEEAEELLIQMQDAGVFSHCPHGRPVAKRFTGQDIQKWFYRT